jgi:hypothetical protein
MKADAIAALRRHRDGRVERSRRPCDGLATLDRAGRSTDDSWLQPRGTARAQHVAEIRYRRIHATKPRRDDRGNSRHSRAPARTSVRSGTVDDDAYMAFRSNGISEEN